MTRQEVRLKEKGKCGVECKSCPYFKSLCFGCTIQTCLVAECLKGWSYTGITYPKSFCILRSYCRIGRKERPNPLPIPEVKRKSLHKINFSKFVPEIDISDKRSWFWKDGTEFSMIFVPLWQLLINESALSKVSSKGLHDYLGFNGKVLLSTVMQDELIDKLKREDYLKLIANLRPDATMVPDNYTYTDVPLHPSWSQTIRLVTFANDFLDLNIPCIGLIKGANLHQIYWSLQKQIEMGYASFVMPARELFEQGLLNDFLQYALLVLDANRDMNNLDSELLLYGVAHRLRHEEVSYSNLAWFIQAEHEHYFRNNSWYDIVDPQIGFEECCCEACKGMMPRELIRLSPEDGESYIKTLIIHNLLEIKKSLEMK